MQFFRAIFLLIFCIFPLLSHNAEKDNQNREQLVKEQKNQRRFVLKFNNQVPLKEYTSALLTIYNLSEEINNRDQTEIFFKRLLDSIKYEKLYSTVYYFLSRFYQKQQRERYLLRSLKVSRSSQDKHLALIRLYQYYRESKIRYLQEVFLKRLIDVQLAEKDYSGLEASLYNLAEICLDKKDYFTALKYNFEALKYSRFLKKSKKGRILLAVSDIFRMVNRKELARKYLKRAIDSLIHQDDMDLKISIFSAHSRLCFEERNFENALQYINRGIKYAQKFDMRIHLISLYYQKSLILKNIGSGTEVVHWLGSAIRIGFREKAYGNLLPIITEYSEWLIDQKKFSQAEFYLNKIDDIYAEY